MNPNPEEMLKMKELAGHLKVCSPSAPHLHVEALIRKGWL